MMEDRVWTGRRALVTGARGTVGRALCAALGEQGAEVIGWDRDRVSPLDREAVRRHVADVCPHAVFHLAVASQPTGADNEPWRINVEWTEALTQSRRDRGVRLVFTSTAMVFSDAAHGPFRIDSQPDAASGYGFEKRTCEERIAAADPSAVVARLGWQIGDGPGSNNMVDHCISRMRSAGRVAASTRWLPACSFLADTAGWLRAGRLKYREDVVDGLDAAPRAFIGLLRGANLGKMLVKVGADPTRR